MKNISGTHEKGFVKPIRLVADQARLVELLKDQLIVIQQEPLDQLFPEDVGFFKLTGFQDGQALLEMQEEPTAAWAQAIEQLKS